MSESCTQASGFIHTPPVPRLIQLGADNIAIVKLVLLLTLSTCLPRAPVVLSHEGDHVFNDDTTRREQTREPTGNFATQQAGRQGQHETCTRSDRG